MHISFDMHLGTDNIPTNYVENGNQLIVQAAFIRVNQPLPMVVYSDDFNVCHCHNLHMFLVIEYYDCCPLLRSTICARPTWNVVDYLIRVFLKQSRMKVWGN